MYRFGKCRVPARCSAGIGFLTRASIALIILAIIERSTRLKSFATDDLKVTLKATIFLLGAFSYHQKRRSFLSAFLLQLPEPEIAKKIN
jgi:hypothetical protein